MSKNYLKIYETRRLALLDSLGVVEEDLKRDVEIFRNWAKQERHLPQDFLDDDGFIERLLVNNKLRIEQSKLKYDNFFTMRTVYNCFFHGIEKVVPSTMPVVKFPLKNTTSGGKCIVLICVANKEITNADFPECLKFHLAVSEILNKYCFSDGKVCILDFKGLKSGLFENFDVLTLHKHLKMLKTCFSGRLTALHLLNMSSFSNFLLGGIKMVFGGELSSKIKVHDTMASLYKEIPRALLPQDYGGSDISVSEYLEIWDEIIREEHSFLKNLRYQAADESLRIGSSHLKLEEFGVNGTFKKLNID